MIDPPTDQKILDDLFRRAQTADVLADDLTVILDAAAAQDMVTLVEVTRILSRRGVKVGVLRKYGRARRKLYASRQRAVYYERYDRDNSDDVESECLR